MTNEMDYDAKIYIKLSFKDVLVGQYATLHGEKPALDYKRVELAISICRHVHLVVK